MRIDEFSDRIRPVGIFYVDVHPIRWKKSGEPEFLALRRVRDDVEVPMPGEWQTVSGKLSPGERISAAFRRQVQKKTQLVPRQLFKFRDVAQFYDDYYDTVMLVPNAIAVLGTDTVSVDESLHDQFEWLSAAEAFDRLIYPMQQRAIEMTVRYLSLGSDGQTLAQSDQVELTPINETQI